MSEDVQGFRFRASPRVPYAREVRLRFDRIGGSVSGTTADLSTEGMFVATGEYKPIGTLVQFEFETAAGETVQGLADIVWIREVRQGTDREPGMGLHFRYVDPRSRELIAAAVRDLLAEKEEKRPNEVAPVIAPAEEPPADETPTADTEPSIVWSAGELPTRLQRAGSEGVGAASATETQGQESTEAPGSPTSPVAHGAAIDPMALPESNTASAEVASAPIAPADWRATDSWLGSEEGTVDRLPVGRGAAVRSSRSSAGWWIGALLLLLAVAAAVAYYRWRESAGSAPEAVAESTTAATEPAQLPASESGAGPSTSEPVAPASEVTSSELAEGAAPAPTGPVDEARAASVPAAPPASPEAALVAVDEPAPRTGALQLAHDAGAAATVVRISAPWELGSTVLRSFRLEAPPRFVVQVRGAAEAVPAAVESAQVRRVRIGAHERDGESEIHFVFDLAGDAVRAQAAVIDGVIVVTFAE